MFVTFRWYKTKAGAFDEFLVVNTDHVIGVTVHEIFYDDQGVGKVLACHLIMSECQWFGNEFIVEGSLAEVTEKLNGGVSR